jgi:hypothetical protein
MYRNAAIKATITTAPFQSLYAMTEVQTSQSNSEPLHSSTATGINHIVAAGTSRCTMSPDSEFTTNPGESHVDGVGLTLYRFPDSMEETVIVRSCRDALHVDGPVAEGLGEECAEIVPNANEKYAVKRCQGR